MKKQTILLLMLVLFCFAGLTAEAQTGSALEIENVDVEIQVDASNASEKNTYSTVNEALDAATKYLKKGKSVKVKIHPGSYEESYRMIVPAEDETLKNTPFIIEGSSSDQTIISGLTGEGFEPETWKPVEGSKGVYEHEWPYEYGLEIGFWANKWGARPVGIGQRREMLFVDGQRLTMQVLDNYEWVDPDGPSNNQKEEERIQNQEGQLVYRGVVENELGCLDRAWTFAICDNSEAPEHLRKKIFMRLPDGKSLEDLQTVKISRLLDQRPWNDALIWIENKNNLIIRDISFRHAGTWLVGSSLQLLDCNNVTLEAMEASYNNGAGTIFKGENLSVLKCKFTYNGGKGFGGVWKDGIQNNMLFEESEFCFNALRTFPGDFVDFDAAGIKISWANDVLFRKCIAVGNEATGFWHDIKCSNVTYDRCFAYGNYLAGFFFEYTSTLEGMGNDLAVSCISAYNHHEGILLGDATRPSIKNCLLVNNGSYGIRYRNMKTRKPTLRNEIGKVTIEGNTIITGNRFKQFVEFDYAEEILPAAHCTNNKYYSVSTKNKFNIGGISMSFNEWQEVLPNSGANDSNSEYQLIYNSTDYFSFNPETKIGRIAKTMDVPIPENWIDRIISK